MDFNVNEINRLIKERRSVYPQMFNGEVIDKEIVEQILENANWAPTHRITEPWRFTVFSGKGLEKLATFQAELYKELSGENFDQKKYDKLKLKPTQCSHVISIGVSPSDKVPEVEDIEAVACAVQNMYLTARAYGIGAYWGSGGVTYKKEANSFFGLRENDTLLGFFFMGYPKVDFPKGNRKPITDKVTWVEE
ncbi:MAG: nitroreductase [Cytophagales bacterium]|nr:nitroreductase [Cytophagales bacterium]